MTGHKSCTLGQPKETRLESVLTNKKICKILKQTLPVIFPCFPSSHDYIQRSIKCYRWSQQTNMCIQCFCWNGGKGYHRKPIWFSQMAFVVSQYCFSCSSSLPVLPSPTCEWALFWCWQIYHSEGTERETDIIKCFRHYLQEADTDENQGSLGFDEFCSFYKMISTRRDLYLILISYSNQKEVLDLHDLARFLENEQKVVKSQTNHNHLFDTIYPHFYLFLKCILSVSDWHQWWCLRRS